MILILHVYDFILVIYNTPSSSQNQNSIVNDNHSYIILHVTELNSISDALFTNYVMYISVFAGVGVRACGGLYRKRRTVSPPNPTHTTTT